MVQRAYMVDLDVACAFGFRIPRMAPAKSSM